MKILTKSFLYSLLLFVTIFLISATIILYFSPAEAESISTLSYWSFWIALPFSIFMFFSNYFILNNLENKKSFWKRFLILVGVVIILSLVMYFTTTIGETEGEPLGFAFIFFIVMPAIFLAISFLLTMLYRFLFRYNEKIIVYILISLVVILILLIIISFVNHGWCLSGDINCIRYEGLEEALKQKNPYLCGGSTECFREYYKSHNDNSVCSSLPRDAERGRLDLVEECNNYFS